MSEVKSKYDDLLHFLDNVAEQAMPSTRSNFNVDDKFKS